MVGNWDDQPPTVPDGFSGSSLKQRLDILGRQTRRRALYARRRTPAIIGTGSPRDNVLNLSARLMLHFDLQYRSALNPAAVNATAHTFSHLSTQG